MATTDYGKMTRPAHEHAVLPLLCCALVISISAGVSLLHFSLQTPKSEPCTLASLLSCLGQSCKFCNGALQIGTRIGCPANLMPCAHAHIAKIQTMLQQAPGIQVCLGSGSSGNVCLLHDQWSSLLCRLSKCICLQDCCCMQQTLPCVCVSPAMCQLSQIGG